MAAVQCTCAAHDNQPVGLMVWCRRHIHALSSDRTTRLLTANKAMSAGQVSEIPNLRLLTAITPAGSNFTDGIVFCFCLPQVAANPLNFSKYHAAPEFTGRFLHHVNPPCSLVKSCYSSPPGARSQIWP